MFPGYFIVSQASCKKPLLCGKCNYNCLARSSLSILTWHRRYRLQWLVRLSELQTSPQFCVRPHFLVLVFHFFCLVSFAWGIPHVSRWGNAAGAEKSAPLLQSGEGNSKVESKETVPWRTNHRLTQLRWIWRNSPLPLLGWFRLLSQRNMCGGKFGRY